MNSYEEKQQARKERLEARAARALDVSANAYKAAGQAVRGIEMGQPILVGHHSERRHRRDLKRADDYMRRSVEASNHASELARRAEVVGTGGISSDDPAAVEKLRLQLEGANKKQLLMKAANKVVKSKKTDEAKIAELVLLGISEPGAAALLKPDFAGRVGFASYQLTNNNANIRRIQQRIEALEAQAKRESVTEEGGGFTYCEDAAENRVMFIFPGKPSAEARATLKQHGFRWSPSRGAWVRMLTGNGVFSAQLVRNWFEANPGALD